MINFIPGDAEAVSNVAYAHKEFAGLHFTGLLFCPSIQRFNYQSPQGLIQNFHDTARKNYVITMDVTSFRVNGGL